MKRTHSLVAAVALVAITFAASPVVLAADKSCNFQARGLSLNFGVINPSIVQDITKPITVVTTSANKAGDCSGGGNMVISVVGTNSRQLVSGTNTINYTISGFPVTLPKPGNAPPGNPANGYTTWFSPGQLNGTILWTAYADAVAGNYVDNVTLSVNP